MLVLAGSARQMEDAIRAVVKDFGEQVLRDLQGIRSVADLSAKVKSLREDVERLTIEKDRKEEEYARKDREIEHKVGLERQRQEQELALAKRESVVSLREEALKADRDRFESQLQFHEKRFTEEVGYLKTMLTKFISGVEMHIGKGKA